MPHHCRLRQDGQVQEAGGGGSSELLLQVQHLWERVRHQGGRVSGFLAADSSSICPNVVCCCDQVRKLLANSWCSWCSWCSRCSLCSLCSLTHLDIRYLKTLFKPSWFNPSWFKHSIHQKSVTWLTEPTVEMLIASKNQQQCLLVFSSPYFVHCLKEDCVKAGHSCNFFQCSQCK